MDPKIEGRLRCRLVTNNVPFLLIQPIKMEEAYHKPLLVIYHNVILDDEIETVKKLAQPRVLRAIHRNSNTQYNKSILFNSLSEPLYRTVLPVTWNQPTIAFPSHPG